MKYWLPSEYYVEKRTYRSLKRAWIGFIVLLSTAVFVSSAVLLLGASIVGNFALAQDMQQLGERMMGGNMTRGGMMGGNMTGGGMMGGNMTGGGMMGGNMTGGGMMGDNMMK